VLKLGNECCGSGIGCGGEVEDVVSEQSKYLLDVFIERLEYASEFVGERLKDAVILWDGCRVGYIDACHGAGCWCSGVDGSVG